MRAINSAVVLLGRLTIFVRTVIKSTYEILAGSFGRIQTAKCRFFSSFGVMPALAPSRSKNANSSYSYEHAYGIPRIYAVELRGVGSRRVWRNQFCGQSAISASVFPRNDARRARLRGLAGLRRAACLRAWQAPLVGGAVRGANDYVSALDYFLVWSGMGFDPAAKRLWSSLDVDRCPGGDRARALGIRASEN